MSESVIKQVKNISSRVYRTTQRRQRLCVFRLKSLLQEAKISGWMDPRARSEYLPPTSPFPRSDPSRR